MRSREDVCRGASEVTETHVNSELGNGINFMNIVKSGTGEQPEALHVTFIFVWNHPEPEVGSADTLAARGRHQQVADTVAESIIATMRRQVAEGTT